MDLSSSLRALFSAEPMGRLRRTVNNQSLYPVHDGHQVNPGLVNPLSACLGPSIELMVPWQGK
jgi:hypothetical protein